MGERTTTVFTCDGCGDEQESERHLTAPHGWRKLTWCSGYCNDEGREAHFCGSCRTVRLKALDVLLGKVD